MIYSGNAVSIHILYNRHSKLDLNPSFTNLLICLVSIPLVSQDYDLTLTLHILTISPRLYLTLCF